MAAFINLLWTFYQDLQIQPKRQLINKQIEEYQSLLLLSSQVLANITDSTKTDSLKTYLTVTQESFKPFEDDSIIIPIIRDFYIAVEMQSNGYFVENKSLIIDHIDDLQAQLRQHIQKEIDKKQKLSNFIFP